MRAGYRRIVAAVVVVGFTLGSEVARAEDSLGDARAAIEDLRYGEANRLLHDALRAGGNTSEQVAAIYRLHGEVLAALGREADAVLKFERLLLLDPGARLSDGVSPKISEPFQAAQKSTATLQPLRISCAVDRADATIVSVVTESDPLSMVAGVRVVSRTGNGRRVTAEPDEEGGEVVVLEADATPLLVAVVDEFGNRLKTHDASRCTGASEGGDPAAPGRAAIGERERSSAMPGFYARWPLWAGVALGVGVMGVYFGVEANSAFDELAIMHRDSENYEYVEARTLERRAESRALYANISFAVAGCAAVAALVLFVKSRRSRKSTVIAPTAGSDGMGVVMVVPF